MTEASSAVSKKLDDIFTPGSQPSVTYVDRAHLGIETALVKAIHQPGVIVSLTGPTKSGKTVLCRAVLKEFEYVWIDGGQIKSDDALWERIRSELTIPDEIRLKAGTSRGANISGTAGVDGGVPGSGAKFTFTIGGSRLRINDEERTYRLEGMHSVIDHLSKNNIVLVIDDFHYLPEIARVSAIQSLKGMVFNRLKFVLLSTPHRAFEAIKAETEITGRFKHVTMPIWIESDLRLIATTGFKALNVGCPDKIVDRFCAEAQGSPLLMQQFCWDICYDSHIRERGMFQKGIAETFDVDGLFTEVARDSGLPLFERLSKGPQSRTERIPRPLAAGGSVDIYTAILMAIAATGPRETLNYDQIRTSLNTILAAKTPQKTEVTNALNQLSSIDKESN
ncbi:MAG TPA: ATP-binding protein, partial [Acetobacteraceae bacterium]|nr:ATP-binding protein [Acetobacteraceae bacterium]